ncbi:MAG: RNA polymerase sigma factor [Anaerolineae bacterium]|nr:RNA polymerase sigma factor [Anaerolineae bacterium]
MTDEQLAYDIQQGEAQALTALIERHYRPLLGYLYRMTADLSLAEDLTQEAFLRMMRAIGSYHYPRPFKAWLYAIATNVTRDHFKMAETRRTVAFLDEDFVGESDMEILEEYKIEETLMNLPARQREVVLLRYYHELSLAEIAEVLGIPVGTVKSRLSIGLQQLRGLMEQQA